MKSHIDQVPGIYFSYNDEGILSEVNSRLCTELGWAREELQGQKVEKIFTVSSRIFQQTHFFPLLKMQGHAEEIFITLLKRDGDHLPVLINAEKRVAEGKAAYVHLGIVVHNRKKFEEELIAARKTAEDALAKNSALLHTKKELQMHLEALDEQIYLVNKQKDEFLQFNRVLTHDLQEPLRKLFVFTNMARDTDDAAPKANALDKIILVSQQLRTIVSGLQHYVWLAEEGPERSEIDLCDLLRQVHKEIELENGIDMRLDCEALPNAIGNPDQVRFLFRELLTNSIRFRRIGVQPHVQVSSNTLFLNKFQSIREKYKYSEFLKIQVKDNGMGFDPVYKDQVFQLFRRLHTESGRGIGLALCRKIVENHHGRIKIHGRKDAGATVTIFLPVPLAGAGVSEVDGKRNAHA
jgi:phosphoserine phosphatase RsbU/P